MKKNNIFLCLASALALTFATACSDVCEYLDTNADNPSWVKGYEEGDEVKHPESLASTKWVRGKGLKYNVYGQEIQGFVESLDFFSADSVRVVMSEGCIEGTWTDESNTAKEPSYVYTYSSVTGTVEIKKVVRKTDDNGRTSTSLEKIFIGVVTQGKKEVLTVCHYGDTPTQTYLIKQ